MKKFLFLGFLFFDWMSFFGCGGGGPDYLILNRPVDIRASNKDVLFRNRTTRFLYVIDRSNGIAIVLDQENEGFVDTDSLDEFNPTAIPVGNEPVALAADDHLSKPRFFVAEGTERKLFGYEIQLPEETSEDFISYSVLNLGGSLEGHSSHPIFVDRGRGSSPQIPFIQVNTDKAKNESWELKFLSDSEGYWVKGSRSGEQKNRAKEGEEYTSDGGEIRFTIYSGGEKTTEEDRFRFGTFLAQPLSLTGYPKDLQVIENHLFVVMSDPASVAVLDLDTLQVVQTIPLNDGSAVMPLPGKSFVEGNSLYIPNQASSKVFVLHSQDFSLDVEDVGIPTKALGAMGSNLYLVHAQDPQLVLWNLDAKATQNSLFLSDLGLCFSAFQMDQKPYALIPLVSGTVEMLDLENFKRLDSNISGDPVESYSQSEYFFDVLPPSSPSLISISTVDQKTRTERWQLTYEGVLPGTQLLEASISDTLLDSPLANFENSSVSVGDLVVLNPQTSPEEGSVLEVVSNTSLRLLSKPLLQGNVSLQIRPSKSYIAFGSLSGFQTNRVFEDRPYQSDDGSVSLTIRSSRNLPTSRGDFFAFYVNDGIQGILAPEARMGVSLAVLTRPNQIDPTGYVTQEGSGLISVLDLRDKTRRGNLP